MEIIERFCKANEIVRFALFGSVLRDDFRPDSDIDVLVKFDENARTMLFDLDRMEEELKDMFGRDVDLVSQLGVEMSMNHMRKRAVLDSALTIYES